MAMVDPQKPVQVLAQAGWHPGVLGIVAGRIMEAIGQTVIVLAIDNGFAKGSARSLEAINIFEALSGNRDLFTAFGGHAGAAGMTLPVDNLEALSDLLCQFVIERGLDQTAKNTLTIDERLSLEDLSLDTLKSLDKLAPMGWIILSQSFMLRILKLVKRVPWVKTRVILNSKSARVRPPLMFWLLVKEANYKTFNKLLV